MLSIAAPVVLALASAVVCRLGNRWHPAIRARVLAVLVAAAGLAAAGWAVVLGGAFLVDVASIDPARLPVAAVLAGHGQVPALLGLAAVAGLVAGTVGTARALRPLVVARRWRRDDDLVITADPEPLAFAVPGRRPSVAVSAGLLRRLQPGELDVVVAHERSHLAHGHHRFVLVAELGIAFAPWLTPCVDVLRFDLERWADEDAAAAVGDRRLVARTIARVALDETRPGTALAFSGHHVLRRVEALLGAAPPGVTTIGSVAAAGTGAAATGVASSALQLHHAVGFLGVFG